MESHCFFAHIAFAIDARSLAHPKATANLLIEIDKAALFADDRKHHLNASDELELADKIARGAALDYLEAEEEFREYPVRRFVDFSPVQVPTYISISPAPTRILPNSSRLWRLAECDSDKLRTKPLPVTR